MTVTENLGALGSWSLTLRPETPREVTDALGLFGHIVILRGRVDVAQVAGASLLAGARYVGVLRDKPTSARTLAGSGMLFWLGDEDNKGAVLEAPVVLTAKTLTQCLTALLPAAVHLGVVHDPGGTYTGTHQWETPRQAIDTVCAAFGVEYRVNGDGSLDVGTQAQLYQVTPDSIISARGSGSDLDVTALGAQFEPHVSGLDYSSRVVMLGQTQANEQIVLGSADAPTVPYKDLFGNPVRAVRMIADSGQTTGSISAAAQLQLNRFNRTATSVKVTAAGYETSGTFVVGDNSYVFDPDNGIFDATQQRDFRGELIFPAIVRIAGLTWQITDGHTVAFRDLNGVWTDLTRWVVWESGADDIVVGDLPKTLLSGGNPVQTYVQGAPDPSVPGPPTGLALASSTVQSSKGNSTATITASWTPPATNTDGSVVTDLDYYRVQYRWQGRAPQWDTRQTADTTIDIAGVAVGLPFDVRVAAVDLAGHPSAWTAISTITTAPDTTGPNPPSDPVVGSYLGQLRVAWDGKDNVGAAMPPDFAYVEVHVSPISGFTPDRSPGSTTLVAQLSTAGVAYATAPYATTRYVKLVAVDNSRNASSPSNQASGATVQVADGDVASMNVGKLIAGTASIDIVNAGRITTALFGARVELNALGLQKWDASNNLLVSITGTDNLMVGVFKTGLSGRRIEVGAAGILGQVAFYAPDGSQTVLEAYTGQTLGTEAIRIKAPVAGTSDTWNMVSIDNGERMFGVAATAQFYVGGDGPAPPGGGPKGFYVSYIANRGTPSTAIPPAGSTQRLGVTVIDSYFAYPSGNFAHLIQGTPGDQRFLDDSNRLRLFIENSSNKVWVMHGATGTFGYTQFAPGSWGPTSVASPGIVLLTAQVSGTGSGFGAGIGYTVNNDGTFPSVNVMNAAFTTYFPLAASAFNVSSDARGKVDEGPTSIRALDLLTATPVHEYRLEQDFDRPTPVLDPGNVVLTPDPPALIDGKPARRRKTAPPKAQEAPAWEPPTAPLRIGLFAHEAPAMIRSVDVHGRGTVSLYQYVALCHKAIQELLGRLEELEGAAS